MLGVTRRDGLFDAEGHAISGRYVLRGGRDGAGYARAATRPANHEGRKLASGRTHDFIIRLLDRITRDGLVLAPETVRDHILTSMLKNANVGTYAFVMSVADGTFQAGNQTFGLANGGVGYSRSGGFVDDIKAQLDAWAADIVAGKIVVPDVP